MQLRTMLATGLVCASVSTAQADTSFAAGSIIIPATATYQTDCGAVSMYGLIYNVLRANAWLETYGHGRIEIHYAVLETKGSPNRCVPTNTMSGPTASPMWVDGCDFQVFSSNPSTVPVKKLSITDPHLTASDIASFDTENTSDAVHTSTTHARSTYPNYAATNISAPTTTTVRYSGGSFVINDQDAVTFRKLLRGAGTDGLIAQDSDGNNISFTNFINASGCTYGTTAGGNVNFHAAQVAFTAPIAKVLASKPPRLALLDRDLTNITGTVDENVLQAYLTRAGLNFSGAGGCPTGGHIRTNSPGLCPSAGIGQIYSIFDMADLVGANLAATELGAQSGGENIYKMFWAPHWEIAGTNPTVTEQQVLRNIGEFAEGQHGVMAECASIGTFEGYAHTPKNAIATNPTSQFMTCSTGTCGHVSRGINVRTVFSHSAPAQDQDSRRNCTDPNLSGGAGVFCAYFADPGDTFVQIGDYKYNTTLNFGTVSDFKPNSTARYKDGVRPLVAGISNLDKTFLDTPAEVRTMPGFQGEFAARHNKDNDTAKSNIIYLGFHDQSSAVAGTKIVLQTLLLLGEPPTATTTREVTRSNPIIASINPTGTGDETDLVQGTFEKIDPAPTSKNATSDATAVDFEFPFMIGHMRAIRVNQISTAGTEFNALPTSAVAFDVADSGNIPPVSAGGCGSNFNGSCRTVFTHTSPTTTPVTAFTTRELFTTGSTAIKNLVAPPATFNATSQNTILTRVLQGYPSGTPGTYVSKLGGVDRSTVAVIDGSLVAGDQNRPEMIYFGATDGMLHAVCAEAAGACPAAGRELWAFIPRTQLPRLRLNTARIDGSPRVVDMFGAFGGTSRDFKTILLLPTGSGDPGVAGEQPSVTALDITDPADPKILWEYVTPTVRGVTDWGTSIEVTAGPVSTPTGTKQVAFVHSNNGGTGLPGSVVTALDIETGQLLWQVGHQYGGLSGDASPAPRLTASGIVPPGGIPGSAMMIDRTGANSITDVIYATLYGDVWRIGAKDGVNPYGTNPLFRFNADQKPIGAAPTIFSDDPNNPQSLFAAFVSGGYFDPAALALWSGSQQHIVAVSVNTDIGDTPLTDSSGGLLKFIQNLAAGEKGFASPTAVGDQLFAVADTTDVNSAAYGLTDDTGTLYQMDLNGGGLTSVTINGGAGSVATDGTNLFYGSGTTVGMIDDTSSLGAITGGAPPATSNLGKGKIERRLWLQTL